MQGCIFIEIIWHSGYLHQNIWCIFFFPRRRLHKRGAALKTKAAWILSKQRRKVPDWLIYRFSLPSSLLGSKAKNIHCQKYHGNKTFNFMWPNPHKSVFSEFFYIWVFWVVKIPILRLIGFIEEEPQIKYARITITRRVYPGVTHCNLSSCAKGSVVGAQKPYF